ncbi:MAG: isoprenylcysteine carboxylmethyltransferase family protein [Chloroflexi bacterium]|nr:MAG: isoprenylcysteine carboxylmethyltransferase family protein [Chloroflexota bacterium]
MRDEEAPGPLTQASAPLPGVPAKSQISRGGPAPGRLAREDARTLGGGTLEMVTGVAEHVQRRSGAYWRDMAFGRLAPALFFSLFLARQLILLWGGIQGVRQPADLLFVGQQLLALTYFTLLVVLYAVRLPQRGTDHRLAVIVIAFSGTFAAIGASFLPGGTHRPALVLVADILATAGLVYSVWGLAYLRRSFSIIPEARRLVTGGPYSLSRHPVYLGEIATAIGINLATAGWLSAAAIVYFVACELLRIRWEERILAQTFPYEYTEYARRVPRYLPNPLSRR